MGSIVDSDYFCITPSQKECIGKEKQEIIDFYEKQVRIYDDIKYFSYWDILYKKYDVLIDRFFTKNSLVVDIGCGTGLISKKLTSKKHSVFGIDISSDFLSLAKTKCNTCENTFVKGIAEKIPLKDNMVNDIACIETLDHVKNIEDAIHEISRICKKTVCLFLI